MATLSKEQILDAIAGMSVLEVAELVKAMEEKKTPKEKKASVFSSKHVRQVEAVRARSLKQPVSST